MAGRGISRTHAAFWPVLRHSRTAVARLPASWAPVTQHSCSRHDVVAVRFTSERPDSEIPPSQTLSLECIYSFTPRWHLWNGYKTLGDGRAVLPSCQFPLFTSSPSKYSAHCRTKINRLLCMSCCFILYPYTYRGVYSRSIRICKKGFRWNVNRYSSKKTAGAVSTLLLLCGLVGILTRKYFAHF